MENFPEWGDGLTKKTPQILPPFYFYFKIIYIIKYQWDMLKKLNTKLPESFSYI